MLPLTTELAYWINERYRIKLAKESGLPPPWSTDPVFNTVRFCNVHREDDKVTRWIRQSWNQYDHPAWRFVVGRMINWPLSLAVISKCDFPWQMKDALKKMRAGGYKVFTSAYTISTCGRKMDKLDYVFEVVEDIAHCEEKFSGSYDASLLFGCYTAHQWLMETDGLGSFLAAQVVADMKNTAAHPLAAAPDWWTFSAPGPGSLRGLSWYFNQDDVGVTASTYQECLNLCRSEVDPLIDPAVPRISNQDFQNCLCEFSKWCKVKYLNGHVRNRYVPHSNG